MEKHERIAKIVVILAPDGSVERAYKMVHTVLVDGEARHTLDPRDVELSQEDVLAYFGEANAVTIANVQAEKARADAAESKLADAVAFGSAAANRADAAESKITQALAALR